MQCTWPVVAAVEKGRVRAELDAIRLRNDVDSELGIEILFSLAAINARRGAIAAARLERLDWPAPGALSAAAADLVSRAAADELLEVAIVAEIENKKQQKSKTTNFRLDNGINTTTSVHVPEQTPIGIWL